LGRGGPEGQALVDQAEAIARQSPGAEYADLASMYHDLAGQKNREGDYRQAETLARKAVQMHLRLHGPNHPETGYGYAYLGWSLLGQGKFAEALPAFRRSTAIFQRAFPPEHLANDMPLTGLAGTLRQAGEARALATLFPSAADLADV